MTDNEIVKVLECCRNGTCRECPYVDEGYCGRRMISGSLDLIKRQQAEIEMLKAEQPTGINELLVIVEDDIRAEAIKWFADKLKARIDKIVFKYGRYCESEEIDKLVEDIDNLVKEMRCGE